MLRCSFIFVLLIVNVYSYPFFSPDGDIPDKDKLQDYEKLDKYEEKFMKEHESLTNLKSKPEKETITTEKPGLKLSEKPTNAPTVKPVTAKNEDDAKKEPKIQYEDASIEDISAEIPANVETINSNKNKEPLSQVIPKTIGLPTIPPSEEPSIDIPKVDTELETANKTVADLTKLIGPAPAGKVEQILPTEIVEKYEKVEPEIVETPRDFFHIDEVHMNASSDKKISQEIEANPHIFVPEKPSTTSPPKSTTSEAPTIVPTHLPALPKGLQAHGEQLPTMPATTSVPTLPPIFVQPTDMPGGHAIEPEPTGVIPDKVETEESFWNKIVAGLKCSMRDCKDALLPTDPILRELTAPTIVRRIRNHEAAMLCTCGTPESPQTKA